MCVSGGISVGICVKKIVPTNELVYRICSETSMINETHFIAVTCMTNIFAVYIGLLSFSTDVTILFLPHLLHRQS